MFCMPFNLLLLPQRVLCFALDIRRQIQEVLAWEREERRRVSREAKHLQPQAPLRDEAQRGVGSP